MFINEKTGFGYVDTVDAILNQSKTKGGEINNDVVYFFVQVLFDVFIARKEFLKQFQLEEKYQEILQKKRFGKFCISARILSEGGHLLRTF
jgi:hypothetical protein